MAATVCPGDGPIMAVRRDADPATAASLYRSTACMGVTQKNNFSFFATSRFRVDGCVARKGRWIKEAQAWAAGLEELRRPEKRCQRPEIVGGLRGTRSYLSWPCPWLEPCNRIDVTGPGLRSESNTRSALGAHQPSKPEIRSCNHFKDYPTYFEWFTLWKANFGEVGFPACKPLKIIGLSVQIRISG